MSYSYYHAMEQGWRIQIGHMGISIHVYFWYQVVGMYNSHVQIFQNYLPHSLFLQSCLTCFYSRVEKLKLSEFLVIEFSVNSVNQVTWQQGCIAAAVLQCSILVKSKARIQVNSTEPSTVVGVDPAVGWQKQYLQH